jgi:plastocyanin
VFGEVTSSQVVIAVVVGVPALVVAVVVLWSLPHRRVRTVATVASVVAVVLIGVAMWAVFRPAGEQAAAGPAVSISPEPGGPSPTGPSPTHPPPPTSPSGAACSPSGNTVTEVAQGLAFEKDCLAAPAQTAFTIDFDNKDSGVPHNIQIFTEDPTTNPGAQSLFMGALVTGPAKTNYQVNPLAAGTYYFHCDVHPTTMHGTFVVG